MTNRVVLRDLRIRIEGEQAQAEQFAKFLAQLLTDTAATGPYPNNDERTVRFYIDADIQHLTIQAESTDTDGNKRQSSFAVAED